MSTNYSVLVLGLDGATLDLILPWASDGHLPFLRGLMSRGVHGNLESTIPPITPCAWSSFMTGTNPGKHGLFDFVEPLHDGNGGYRYTNASSRHGESLWGLLSRKGRRVGVVNVPMTFPPEAVDGFMISGLDTPHVHSEFMYPKKLKQELKAAGIRYQIDMQHLGNMCTDARRKRQLSDILLAEAERARAFKLLSNRYPAEFRMIVFGATDQVQHHFWHYMDPSHDKFDPRGAAVFRNAILDTYKHIDTLLGSIVEEAPDDTIVIVMSDHGFGPTSNVRVRMNQLLEQHQLLEFVEQREGGRVKRSLANILDRLLRRTLSSGAKRMLSGILPGIRVWFEKLEDYEIDWTRTKAFVNESFRASPAIWVNQVNADDPDLLMREIVKIVGCLVDPQTGKPAISNVYQTRDLYHGPFADDAPELLLSWWEDGFLLERSEPDKTGVPVVERSTATIQGGVEFAGSHRLYGTFMISGGPVKKGATIEGAQIIDVAPTVLHVMGVQVPRGMDGNVLSEVFESGYMRSHPVRYSDDAPASDSEGYQDYTPEESRVVEERLKALGYIE